MAPPSKLRRGLVLALAGGSLAIGVPAAVAAGGDASSSGSAAPAAAPGFVQDQQQQQTPPDRGDCPERGSGSGSGGTTAL